MQQLLLTIPLEKELNSTIITLQYLMKVLFYMAEKTNKPGLPGIPKTKMLMYPMHPLDRMEISFYTFSVNKRMSGMNLCGNCLLYRSFAPLQTMDKQQPFRTTFLRRKTITKSPVRRNYSPV